MCRRGSLGHLNLQFPAALPARVLSGFRGNQQCFEEEVAGSVHKELPPGNACQSAG